MTVIQLFAREPQEAAARAAQRRLRAAQFRSTVYEPRSTRRWRPWLGGGACSLVRRGRGARGGATFGAWWRSSSTRALLPAHSRPSDAKYTVMQRHGLVERVFGLLDSPQHSVGGGVGARALVRIAQGSRGARGGVPGRILRLPGGEMGAAPLLVNYRRG